MHAETGRTKKHFFICLQAHLVKQYFRHNGRLEPGQIWMHSFLRAICFTFQEAGESPFQCMIAE
ncbi:hypothetical protein GC102_14365 [Paenibacillus sp. LMG 31460]|uniref:Uncharacterized protein n=1 Tax=Paenibacillus germinis TaxID=2654979 RepID=A0ABX1Z2B9_9BACL|nr:hypothetical protein [Paenibacillus germinis]NOU86954.1 hypothetical protein [Paenibacillus germinis]